MNEHTCHTLIMELNLHTLVPVPVVSSLGFEHGYLNILCHLWDWAKVFTFFWNVCFGWQLYLCLEMHMADTFNYFFKYFLNLLIFLVWDTRGVIFLLVYQRWMWMRHLGCDIVGHVFFASVGRLICIQDVTLCPDMNHWATCILEEPVL